MTDNNSRLIKLKRACISFDYLYRLEEPDFRRKFQEVTKLLLLEGISNPVDIAVQFVVVSRFNMILPDRQIDPSVASDTTPVESMAVPEFHTPGPVEAIIGAGTFGKMLSRSDPANLAAGYTRLGTELGYVILGAEKEQYQVGAIRMMEPTVSTEDLNKALERLWTLEECPKDVPMSPEDRWCEEQFETTHRREETERYVVKMPIMHERLLILGDTRERALRVFYGME